MEKFSIRRADIQDFDRLVDLYSQLTTVGNPNMFKVDTKIYDNIYVITHNQEIVGAITVLVEPKIIHNGSKVAHIEDLVVDKEYRGMGLGSKLLQYAIDKAKEDCYKIILDCDEDMVKYYKIRGFKPSGFCMRLDLID